MVGSIDFCLDLPIGFFQPFVSGLYLLIGVVGSIGFCPDLPNEMVGWVNRFWSDLPIVMVRSTCF